MNFKKTFATLAAIAIALPFAALADDNDDRIEVDYNEVEVNVTMNPQHYRELLKRFEDADTTLRVDEVALVYYGYPSTIGFDPTYDYSETDLLFGDKRYCEALPVLLEALKADPVNLTLIVQAAISAAECDPEANKELFEKLQERFDMLVSTIMLSGNGIDYITPFLVICDADAKIILRQVLAINDITGHAASGYLEAYRFRFPDSEREHLLYFDNFPEYRYRAKHGLTTD